MIEILVKRGAGDKPSPSKISDPLITSIPVALARGSAEINSSCSDRKNLTVSLTLIPFKMPGGLVRLTTHQASRVGKINRFEKEYSLSEDEFTASCNMGVEIVDE